MEDAFEVDNELMEQIAKQYERSFGGTILDIDDLIQEAKLKYLLSRHKIPLGSSKGYIATIIRNHFNSLLKKASYQATEIDYIPDMEFRPIFFAGTNTLEKQVLDLLIVSYSAIEICSILDITYYKYKQLLCKLRTKVLM
ncbi:MAG TPA: hypothetical protein VMV86_00340 [Methanosarcinales archaeon]|nr:hypothetical protein [Methanosarcinales archaeon]